MGSNRELYLPANYKAQAENIYFDDSYSIESDTVFQPEVYPLAEYLLAGTKRTRLVDVGCGVGRKLAAASADQKLGIDFGANIGHCRTNHPDAAEWREIDLGVPVSDELIGEIGPSDIVICSDVVEHIPDPRHLLAFLSAAFRRGALVITSTPDRVLVRGADHLGPPPNPTHIREWASTEYAALLTTSGLPPLYLGLTHNNDKDRLLRTIISIHEPRLQLCHQIVRKRPLAILSCFNEEDVIGEVIEHWIAQGCDLHVVDNWSTDNSWHILQTAAERFGEHLILERFPAQAPERSSWREILDRKAEIGFCHKGRWIIHTDADEIRLSPFEPFTISDAMQSVERAGWNRINFTVLNHRPVDLQNCLPGALRTHLPYFEFGTKPGHFIQKKAWLQGDCRIDLASSGGHNAEFPDAADCPYHFILHHYPLRSAEHAYRKINQERNGRWNEQELSNGWHSHYAEFAGEKDLIWDRQNLYDSRVDFWATHGLQILSGISR